MLVKTTRVFFLEEAPSKHSVELELQNSLGTFAGSLDWDLRFKIRLFPCREADAKYARDKIPRSGWRAAELQ